jgi:hypothetical protein
MLLNIIKEKVFVKENMLLNINLLIKSKRRSEK